MTSRPQENSGAAGWLLAATLLLTGCAAPDNPSFPITAKEAEAQLAVMRESPAPVLRPVVCINGWNDVGTTGHYERHFGATVNDDRVVIVQVHNTYSMEAAREKVITAVNLRFPSDDPRWTVPVDVVAFSMGGLVARDAADPGGGDRSLRIVRLFSVATPHQGANSALLPLPGKQVFAMRAGSDFLNRLDSAVEQDYELTCYTRLGDIQVGAENTFPPGDAPYWVATPLFHSAHIGAIRDPRIMLDITRMLCGLSRVTVPPPTPLP